MLYSLNETELYNTYGGGIAEDVGKKVGEALGFMYNCALSALIYANAAIQYNSERDSSSSSGTAHGGAGRSF